MTKDARAFTIVELLIVIVVIAILAAISVVAYNGIQSRAKNAATRQAVAQVDRLIQAYHSLKGSYPSTGGMGNVYTDANCAGATDSDGQKTQNWIPDISEVSSSPLPQSDFTGAGINGYGGCYVYASDGSFYVLSAWNSKYGGPSTDGLYRRLGFRGSAYYGTNYYLCNNTSVGGNASGYSINQDIYKHSYTTSNITTTTSTSCDESPPSGA